MKKSIKAGLGFGITSGIITTLGLIMGLNASTHSKIVVLGGILSIAIADAFSDSLGMHISQEITNKKRKVIWEVTLSTLVSKFVFALSFAIPIILFELSLAIMISVGYGLLLLAILSFYMAKNEKENPLKVITEHLSIAVFVLIATYYIGNMIGVFFV